MFDLFLPCISFAIFLIGLLGINYFVVFAIIFCLLSSNFLVWFFTDNPFYCSYKGNQTAQVLMKLILRSMFVACFSFTNFLMSLLGICYFNSFGTLFFIMVLSTTLFLIDRRDRVSVSNDIDN